MSVISAYHSSLMGIQRGMEGMRKHAAEIASAEQFTAQAPDELAEPLVYLKLDALYVKANAKALSIVSETLGTIIDTKA